MRAGIGGWKAIGSRKRFDLSLRLSENYGYLQSTTIEESVNSVFQRNQYYTATLRRDTYYSFIRVIYSRVMIMRNNHVHAIGSRVRTRARCVNLPWKIRTVHSPGGS